METRVLSKTDVERLNSIGAQRSKRMDADGVGEKLGYWFDRQLEQIMERTYEERRQPRNALEIFNRDDSISRGATSYTHRIKSFRGKAKIIEDYGEKLPRVDVVRDEFPRPIKDIGTSYEITVREAMSAMHSGDSLETDRGQSAREAIEDKHNDLFWDGEEDLDVWGFNSHPYVPRYGFSQSLDYTTNANTIIAELNEFISQPRLLTDKQISPDTLLLPTELFEIVSSTRVPDTQITILQHLEQANPHLSEGSIRQVPELDGKGENGEDLCGVFRNRTDTIKLVAPILADELSPQMEALITKVPFLASNGGMYIARPKEVVIGVVPN